MRARITPRARTAMGRAGPDRSTTSVASEFGVSWLTAWRAIRAAARHSGDSNVTRQPGLSLLARARVVAGSGRGRKLSSRCCR